MLRAKLDTLRALLGKRMLWPAFGLLGRGERTVRARCVLVLGAVIFGLLCDRVGGCQGCVRIECFQLLSGAVARGLAHQAPCARLEPRTGHRLGVLLVARAPGGKVPFGAALASCLRARVGCAVRASCRGLGSCCRRPKPRCGSGSGLAPAEPRAGVGGRLGRTPAGAGRSPRRIRLLLPALELVLVWLVLVLLMVVRAVQPGSPLLPGKLRQRDGLGAAVGAVRSKRCLSLVGALVGGVLPRLRHKLALWRRRWRRS